MARQNIGIGAAPNDDTGDSLRVGADKANDNFIELYSMFDAWPGNFSYWPLGGAADLTAHTTVDGNSFDLSFGDPNPLNSFEVSVIENFHFHSDDGTYHAHIEIVNEALNHYLQLLFTDGTEVTSVTMQDNLLTLIADDGVDNSSITFSPLNAIFNLADAGQFAIRDEAAADILVVSEDLTTILATDGVDSSSFSLTPTGLIAQANNERFVIDDQASLTPLGVRGVYMEHGDLTAADRYAYISANNDAITLYHQNDAAANIAIVEVLAINDATPARVRVAGSGDFAGAGYDGDYSTEGISFWGDRWIPDKGYVDSVVPSSSIVLQLASYTVAGVPSASPAGRLIYVTNEGGGPVVAFSNGSNWLRVTDGNPISA